MWSETYIIYVCVYVGRKIKLCTYTETLNRGTYKSMRRVFMDLIS